jgi:DNA-binding HxlR family transcriptional regulator
MIHDHDDDESTGVSVYKRDKRMNEIQEKIEENRKKMLEKRLELKKYAKTNSNPRVNEIIKKYDEYYHEFKTNVKLQIRALEEIMRHLNDVAEEHIQNSSDINIDELVSISKSQLKKDKIKVLKEIKQLGKLLL